jgi:hypothetical protein
MGQQIPTVQKDVKLCFNCKHHRVYKPKGYSYEEHGCFREAQKIKSFNLVSGECASDEISGILYCSREREVGRLNNCGQEGRFFEEKLSVTNVISKRKSFFTWLKEVCLEKPA